MKRVLFITTTNLSTNPRLFKEIQLAERLGYEVTYIAFHLGGWSDKNDHILSSQIKAKSYYLSALRSPYWRWFFNTSIHLLCRGINSWTKSNLWIAAVAHTKRTFQILAFLPQITTQFDFIIGHNLGALYPSWVLARKRDIAYAFDVEDYHPGESSAQIVSGEVERRKFLLSSLLPNVTYYSYASPMIGTHTSQLFHTSLFLRRFVVNNCFSQDEFIPPSSTDAKLRLVWFSQNISKDRGIEWMLPMLDTFKDQITLTLIGSPNLEFTVEYLTERSYIEIVSPLSQKTLNRYLSAFDIGLAIELDTTDLNRQICLTNKIWAYLQAGLFILATDTPAQRLFISEHRAHGVLVEQNPLSFCAGLRQMLQRKKQIRDESFYRYTNARNNSWEEESRKLIKVWEEVLV